MLAQLPAILGFIPIECREMGQKNIPYILSYLNKTGLYHIIPLL